MKSFFVALMCVPLLTACAPNLTSIVYFERQQPSSKKIELLEQALATYDEDDFQWQMNHPSGKVLPCYSPLDCAIYTGDLEVARFLLEQGALPDLKPMIGVGDDADKTNYLIQNVVLRAETDSEAATALALLLEHGANPNLCSRNSPGPPLNTAIRRHFPKTVEVLLENGATLHSKSCEDPPGSNPFYLAKLGPMPVSYAPLEYAVLKGRDGDATDQEILSLLLKYGADPFDMGFTSPKLNGLYTLASYAGEKGKPRMAEFFVEEYSALQKMNDRQIKNFRAELERRDRNLKAYRIAEAEKKRTQMATEARQRAQEVVDDSNTWAASGMTLLKEAEHQYQLADQRKLPPVSGSAGSVSAAPEKVASQGPQKRVDNSCDDSPHCLPTSYDGPYQYTKQVTGFGRGYNNETACERSRQHISISHECEEWVDGKLILGAGVSYDACECTELEFKSECRTPATVYCGLPAGPGGQGVQVE